MEKVIYKKTQFSLLIWAVIVPVSLVLLFISLKAEENIPSYVNLGIFILLILTALIFSRLTITLTNKKIEAAFGLRLFVQKLELKEINIEDIEVLTPSSWYGIGLRLTPKGTLYNVKFGKAIRIKTNQKTLFVGSDEAEIIKDLLIEELKKEN